MPKPLPTYNASVPPRRLAMELIISVLKEQHIPRDMLKRFQPDDPEQMIFIGNEARLYDSESNEQSIARVFFTNADLSACVIDIPNIEDLLKPSSASNYRALLEEDDVPESINVPVFNYEHISHRVNEMPERLMYQPKERLLHGKPNVNRSINFT